MNIDAKDVIEATQIQRNGAANDAAQYYALWKAAVRENNLLKEKYESKQALKEVKK